MTMNLLILMVNVSIMMVVEVTMMTVSLLMVMAGALTTIHHPRLRGKWVNC